MRKLNFPHRHHQYLMYGKSFCLTENFEWKLKYFPNSEQIECECVHTAYILIPYFSIIRKFHLFTAEVMFIYTHMTGM